MERRDRYGDQERYGGYYRGYGARDYGPEGARDEDRGYDRSRDEARWQSGFRGGGGFRSGEMRPEARGFRIGPYAGRGPSGYRRSDERIREDVCDRLTEDPGVDAYHIEITVHDGEVTLEGTVEDRRSKRDAEDLVDEVPGVRQVHNRLRVDSGAPGREGRSMSEHAGGRPEESEKTTGRPSKNL
jgi:HSP20 family molecular chaperone IbpA